MASPSKENQLLELILENSPLKQWHFEEFVKNTDMTRAAVNKWLKKFQQEGLIKRVKKKGKFPHFTCGHDNPTYLSRKKQYALEQIYKSGFAKHLIGLESIKTAIIFGSISRGDWYKGSDIDLFIYGKPTDLEKHKYELKFRRDIETHIFHTKEDIKRLKTGLIKNIVNGHIIKGSIQDFAEVRL